MRKLFALFLVLNLVGLQVLAFDLDPTVDDEIRRNYNPSKLETEALPPLPKTAAPKSTPTPTPTPVSNTSTNTAPKVLQPLSATSDTSASNQLKARAQYDSTAIKIPKGTKFRVLSHDTLNDNMAKGRKLTFTSTRSVTKRYITVPSATVFKGVIVNSHQPQPAGNGGLLVLKVDKMNLNGKEYPVNAYITKANTKKVFINNIKGKRGYAKGVIDSTRPGRTFYHNMVDVTSRLADGPYTVLLSPFTVIAGVLVLGVNVIGSPLFGLFYKGKKLAIPAGAEFEIKFLDDLYLE